MDYPKVVYAIQHRVTKKIYIGLTKNLEERYWAHLSLLRKNKHHSKLMQEEYNEHGGEYDVFVLDEVTKYSERHKEHEWMRRYKTQDKRYGYNYRDRGRVEKMNLLEGKPEQTCD